MTVEHSRSVILTVRDDEHNATFSVEQVHHWPNHEPEHISLLIRQVCEDMIEHIRIAEATGD